MAAPAASPAPAGSDFASPAASIVPPGGSGLTCGRARWAVKTLSDPQALAVNFTPQKSSIAELRTLPAPKVTPNTPRSRGIEMSTFTIEAELQEMTLENDFDVHLVISQPGDAAQQMIVEFPRTECGGAVRSAKRQGMSVAREAFTAGCGAPQGGRFTRLQGAATITGVGFFDEVHGQAGVAPNGIELHPVLRVEGLQCVPTGPTAGTPSRD
jgi:hypothetical protein